MTPIIPTLASIRSFEDGYAVEPDENWYQGRTLYGGLIAAIAVEVARKLMPELAVLRSAQFTFAGPSSGVVVARPTLLRSGRTATFIGVDVSSAGAIAMRAAFTFAGPRESKHRFFDMPVPEVAPPAVGASVFDMPGAPRSTSNFEGRLVGGKVPFTGADRPELLLWLRHRGEVPPTSESALLALADASPPAVFPIFSLPAPISTVTWSIDLTGLTFDASSWFLAHTRSAHVENGYSLQATTLWSPAGEPILEARQLVALYD